MQKIDILFRILVGKEVIETATKRTGIVSDILQRVNDEYRVVILWDDDYSEKKLGNRMIYDFWACSSVVYLSEFQTEFKLIEYEDAA